VFRLYDADAGTLEAAAATPEADSILGERPVYAVGEGYPGDVFASGDSRIVPNTGERLGEVQSAMYYPVGVHGTLSICSTEPDAFDETDEQVLALLATSAAAACMRAKREREVREAREHTEQVLERINGLLDNTVEVLVQATTREEIESGVVDELAATDPYSFAMIGQPNVTTETLAPTASAGDATVPIRDRKFDLGREAEPVSKAYRTQKPQVIERLDSLECDPWQEPVSNSSVESLVVVPLVYKDVTYGVAAVFADEPAAFDEREQVVLNALGRAIANAINAVERGRILDATEIIELEFAINDRDLLFGRLSARSDCRIEVADTDYRPDGTIRLYVTGHDVAPEELLEATMEDQAVVEATCIVEHEAECLLELVVEDSLLGMLTEYGAVPKTVSAENGVVEFTVELPYEAEARELFELVEKRHPGTDLLGYHEREREVETRQDFRAGLEDSFTDRQKTAIRTAYLGGFFEWPRDVDGNELAEAMDISRPTYHQHLRAAQRKVLQELFD
jgi:predicted DNA binding protein/putative methionine-R-sulfoxide reductase with GAF domain